MLDLGFGKIESYVKLEKLGEGKSSAKKKGLLRDVNDVFLLGTYATVYKGKSHLLNGFIALKEIRLEQEEGRLLSHQRRIDFQPRFVWLN
jgi:hypothetical protein